MPAVSKNNVALGFDCERATSAASGDVATAVDCVAADAIAMACFAVDVTAAPVSADAKDSLTINASTTTVVAIVADFECDTKNRTPPQESISAISQASVLASLAVP